MGSKLIWIAATFAYGIVCAAIFTFLRWRQGAKAHHLRRFLMSSACFLIIGAVIVYALWRMFSL